MKKVGVVICVFALACGIAIGAGAGGSLEAIQAALAHDIRFVVNGSVWSPIDTDGTRLSPIVYRGRTYLPVRAISEAIDLYVVWDGQHRTVTIGQAKPVEPRVYDEGDLPAPDWLQSWIETLIPADGVFVRKDGDRNYVLITMGEMPTGGYAVELVSAELVGGLWRIQVRYRQPGPDEMVTQAITHPYLLVAVEPALPVTVSRVQPLGAPVELQVYEHGAADISGDVTVTSPVPYQTVAGEIRLRGQVSVDTVTVELEDGHRVLIPSRTVRVVREGSGWAFNETLSYPAPSSPVGTLIVTAGPHSVTVPVRFADWSYEAK